jgi:DNA-binding protein H-NS
LPHYYADQNFVEGVRLDTIVDIPAVPNEVKHERRKTMDELVRERIILYIKRRMKEYGVTAEHLVPPPDEQAETAAAIPKTASTQPVPTPGHIQYADAAGNSWDGAGPMPEWLQRAVHAGQSVDFFKR